MIATQMEKACKADIFASNSTEKSPSRKGIKLKKGPFLDSPCSKRSHRTCIGDGRGFIGSFPSCVGLVRILNLHPTSHPPQSHNPPDLQRLIKGEGTPSCGKLWMPPGRMTTVQPDISSSPEIENPSFEKHSEET
uniref:Uncharacterized protein n=1 Tax=Opuntia streptacantha TaxID=393608 RepID=A0A7C9EG84_OPUST